MSYSEQMLQALESGQLEAAQSHFAKALRDDDDDMLYSLAEELYALGFLNQARRAYRRLLNRYPDEDDLKTALADIAIDEGEVDVALDYLAQIPSTSSAYLQALLVKADLYQSEALTEAAEKSLLEAEQLAPDEPIIQFALAEYYYDTRAFQKALPRYRALLVKGIRELSRVDLVARIGVAYAEVGQYDYAVGYLEQIQPERMSLDTRFQFAVVLLQLERDEEAIETFNAILALDPNYTSIYPILGQAYEQQQQPEAAYRTYQSGLAVDQTNYYLYRLAGLSAQQAGDLQQAQAYLLAALQLEEEDLPSVLALSRIYLHNNEHQSNIDLLQHYVEIDDIDPVLYWQLAKSYAALDNFDRAGYYFEMAEAHLQHDATFLYDLIQWHRENGDATATVRTLKTYLMLEPEDTDMQYLLADLESQDI